MIDLRYPVGKFTWPTEVTAAQRAAHIETIAALPHQLRTAVAPIPAEHLDVPYREGGWTIRQMVHHIPDSHLNSYLRFKLALTEDNPTIKPYDEAAFARLGDSSAPLEPSLALLDGLHHRWVLMLRGMTGADWERSFQHPEIGPVKLKSNLALYDWHSRHHLAQIEATAKRLRGVITLV